MASILEGFESEEVPVNGINFTTQPGGTVIVGENGGLTMPEVVIPATIQSQGGTLKVTAVGQGAFHMNKHITRVTFPRDSEVTSFEERAFQNCEKLTEIQFPRSLNHFDLTTFRHTPKLTVIDARGNPAYVVENGILYSQDKSQLFFCPRNKSGVIQIPASVTAIGPYAFEGCVDVVAIQFAAPQSIVEIGDGAFAKTSITEFQVPPKVSKFTGSSSQESKFPRDGFLQDCSKLVRIDFVPGTIITEIPESAFRGTGITEIQIPKSVTKLSTQCFAKTRALKAVTFEAGSSLDVIEEDVFYSTGIETIIFPKSVNKIAPSQFFSSPALKNFGFQGFGKAVDASNGKYKVQDGVMRTQNDSQILFADRTIQRVVIPASVEVIASHAFCNCRLLVQVDFAPGSQLISIGSYAFFDTAIQAINIPDGVIRINENAFGKCEHLTTVTFGLNSKLNELGRRVFSMTALDCFEGPGSLRKVGSGAFANSKVRKVTLPEKVDSVDNLMFFSCKALTDLYLHHSGKVSIQPKAFEKANPAVQVHEFDGQDKPKYPQRHQTGRPRGELPPVPIKDLVAPPIGGEIYEKAARRASGLGDLVLERGDRKPIEGVRIRNGSYGRVMKCVNVAPDKKGQISAVKELATFDNSENLLMREIEVMRKISHPAILGLVGFVMPDEAHPAQIVTEWMPRGSLEDLLKNKAEYKKLTPTQKTKIVLGICKGMAYIHASGGMHRDLKPGNILLDENYEIRIADFGSARFSSAGNTLTRTAGLGTPLYMAPEAYDENYTESVDIFSFAMMLWEIATGRSLVDVYQSECTNPVAWFRKVTDQNVRPPTANGEVNATVGGILECCWDTDPENRMDWDDIMDFLKTNKYNLVGEVEEGEVDEYLARIATFEDEFKPEKEE